MLTSADFQAEQQYMNNKRRFLNTMMYGSGVICGCSVYSLDDLSILVESGVAVDDFGREIVVESSVVKKLSSIEGFEQLTGSEAVLCIRYSEEGVHSVYSVGRQDNKGSDYEFNRISEGYELFLMDAASAFDDFAPEDEFLLKNDLYSDTDFKVSLIIPAKVCRSGMVKAVVRVDKLSDKVSKLTYHGTLQFPVFTYGSDSHELNIDLIDIALDNGRSVEKEYWLKAQDSAIEGTEFVIKTGSVHVLINGNETASQSVAPVKVSIIDSTPQKLITGEISKLSLEMRTTYGLKDYQKLALIKLVRTESAYIIDKIIEDGIKKYIATPAEYSRRHEYLSFFNGYGIPVAGFNPAPSFGSDSPMHSSASSGLQIASGTLEIPLGDKIRKGDIRYSGEIMHGLGKGNVYVQIGYENISADRSLGTNAKSTVYGNMELFDNSEGSLGDIETAVKVLDDKGSFVVAARLNKDVNYLLLSFRWVAIKFPSGNDFDITKQLEGGSITAETPTVVLGTKDSFFFNVKFNNMDKCSITYELTEEGSGEITSEGVYTAPIKEGVYEIRISCTDMPSICTYAYAIVKKKGLENKA